MSAEGASANVRPQTQQFRRAARKPALSPEKSQRQAAVTGAAWRFFGASAPMITFLNNEHAGLGGRPLDLAVNSNDGLAAVLATLRPRSVEEA